MPSSAVLQVHCPVHRPAGGHPQALSAADRGPRALPVRLPHRPAAGLRPGDPGVGQPLPVPLPGRALARRRAVDRGNVEVGDREKLLVQKVCKCAKDLKARVKIRQVNNYCLVGSLTRQPVIQTRRVIITLDNIASRMMQPYESALHQNLIRQIAW